MSSERKAWRLGEEVSGLACFHTFAPMKLETNSYFSNVTKLRFPLLALLVLLQLLLLLLLLFAVVVAAVVGGGVVAAVAVVVVVIGYRGLCVVHDSDGVLAVVLFLLQ